MFLPAGIALCGPYSLSAHGNSTNGVNRIAPEALGYAIGNCAHCHEQHGTISSPTDEGSPYLLVPDGLVSQAENICLYCHEGTGSLQVDGIDNYQYSGTFGCASTSSATNGILETFELLSNHNLDDIDNFLTANPSIYDVPTGATPCSGCHNPHRAKRNVADTDNPAESVLSKPSDHETLWTESMDTAFATEYEPPYCSGTNREPDGVGSATLGRQGTPNYIAFCADCHNSSNTIYSTNFGRNLHKIDWSDLGEKHGQVDRDVTLGVPYQPLFTNEVLRGPYTAGLTGSGGDLIATGHYVLSCLDCHEPHGSDNVTLIRSHVNSEDLTANITSSETYNPSNSVSVHNKEMGYLCQKCHYDDATLMTGGSANAWRAVHHRVPDAPYPDPNAHCANCGVCHGPGGAQPITCSYCHFHGTDDSWVEGASCSYPTRRTTF